MADDPKLKASKVPMAPAMALRGALTAKLVGFAPPTVFYRHDTAVIVVELTPAAAARLTEVLK